MDDPKKYSAEMSPPLDRLFDLFLACREMEVEAARVWLSEACQGDMSLQYSVEKLLREDASAEGFLEPPD